MRSHSRSLFSFLALLLSLSLSSVVHADITDDVNEGDKHLEAGNFKKAAKSFDKAIRKEPRQVSPGAYKQRASIFFIERKYEEGLRWIVQTAEKYHPNAPEIMEQKALFLWALGSKVDAVKIAESVTASRPEAYSNQLLIGKHYQTRKEGVQKTVKALSAYFKHRPEDLKSEDARPRLILGLALLATGNANKALKQFQTVERDFKRNQQWQLNVQNGLCAVYTQLRQYDRAITTCDRLIANPGRIAKDVRHSAFKNITKAYLLRNQPQLARRTAQEYRRRMGDSAPSLMLVGDTYAKEAEYDVALGFYNQANDKSSTMSPSSQIRLLQRRASCYMKLSRFDLAGDLYRRWLADATDEDDKRLASFNLARIELAEKKDGAAINTVEKYIADDPETLVRSAQSKKAKERGVKELSDADAKIVRTAVIGEQAQLRAVAGIGYYNQNKLGKARSNFESARKLKPNDRVLLSHLVQTINMQAYQSFSGKKTAKASSYLSEAYDLDKSDALTNKNLAVLSLEGGKCKNAKSYLGQLSKNGTYRTSYNRLMARVSMCGKKPDTKSASSFYKEAEKSAKSSGDNLMLAEIYTEWAPLTMKSNVGDAVDKLEQAVQLSARQPGVQRAAKRNLALALFRRGWVNIRKGASNAAVADLERATREPKLLKGTEEGAFNFSLAVAYLEAGDTSRAEKLFRTLSRKKGAKRYLKAPYDTVGNQFFAAYAKYRSKSAGQRAQAAKQFTPLLRGAKGKFRTQLTKVLSSAWANVAYDAYSSGKRSGATSALKNAAKYAGSAANKKFVDHNRAVLSMGKSSSGASKFKVMNGTPPESLVNLGILLDRQGKKKEAYEAWVSARDKGVRSPKLTRWIATKKRIFGY